MKMKGATLRLFYKETKNNDDIFSVVKVRCCIAPLVNKKPHKGTCVP